MQVLLFALGSAGDVHPMLGLATALRARGHQVTVATNPYFEDLIAQVGLPLIPLGTADELREVMEDPGLWDPRQGFEFVVHRMMIPYMSVIYDIVAARYVPGETVVVAPPTALGARVANAKLGVPLATMHLAPSLIRSVYHAPVLPPMLVGDGVPRWLKRFQYWLVDILIIDRALAGPVNEFLAEKGLPPVRGIMNLWWHSPNLVLCLFPDWFGPMQPDWPKQTVHTGFPLWDEGEVTAVAPEVEVFLEAGDAPIAFTPGSAMLHGHEFFRTAVAACQQLGRRGILLTRHREQLPPDLPPGVRHFDYVPLGALLPRCAAIVHHGGVGTLAQGLAVGIPQVVLPMAHDQHDNADRLLRLGISETIPQKQRTGSVLATTLGQLLDSRPVLERCRELAARFNTPDALEQSCNAIEAIV